MLEPFASRRRILARRLAALHPELELGAGDALHLPRGEARIVITIEARDAVGAFARGRTAGLRYTIEGNLAAAEKAQVRAAVLAIGQSLSAVEDPSDDARPVESLEELASIPAGARALLAPLLLADPSALIPAVERLHQAELRGHGPGALLGLPPCLSIEMRPEAVYAEVASRSVTLPKPCDTCGVAARCPAPLTSPPAAALRPLRHADATAAALSAVTSIAAAFDRPVPATALRFLTEVQALRRGLHSITPLPLELSLKCTGARVDPTLRLVEYSPRSPRGAGSRESRGPARRRALVGIVERLAGTVASEASAWIERLEPHASAGLELSIGVEIDLASDRVRPQLYAHVEPESEPRHLVEAMLAFAGTESQDVQAIAEGPHPSALVLAAYGPTAAALRRVKLYFARPLVSGHARSGLAPASLDPFAAFAPDSGLAVLAADAGGCVWEKWDFPCARHFQATGALPAAFARGLDEPDAERVHAILDGGAFAPWYTWLSVGRVSRAVYFVPR
jgi:hypothetical protein